MFKEWEGVGEGARRGFGSWSERAEEATGGLGGGSTASDFSKMILWLRVGYGPQAEKKAGG